MSVTASSASKEAAARSSSKNPLNEIENEKSANSAVKSSITGYLTSVQKATLIPGGSNYSQSPSSQLLASVDNAACAIFKQQ